MSPCLRFSCRLLLLLCSCQARQDILAQDLAEAIDSQVELAEQLRCYREDNEKLLTEKHAVCVPEMVQTDLPSWCDLHVWHVLCACTCSCWMRRRTWLWRCSS